MPATITITYPKQMVPNSDNTANVSIHMNENNVLVLFDYFVNLSTSLNLWYLTKNMTMLFNGGMSLKIPLGTIGSLQRSTGLNGISDPHTFGNYLTINSIYINAALLGTLFNASVSIDLYKILSNMVTVYQPELKPIFTILNVFISAINFDITPSLQGLVLGNIASSDPSVATLSTNSFILDAQDKPQSIGIHTTGSASSSSTFNLQITNYMYAMNFTNTWSIDIVPSKLLSYFVSDIPITLGVYPNIQSTVAGGSSGAVDSATNTITTQNIQIQSGTEQTTTSQNSPTSSGFTAIWLLLPLLGVALYVHKKRKIR